MFTKQNETVTIFTHPVCGTSSSSSSTVGDLNNRSGE